MEGQCPDCGCVGCKIPQPHSVRGHDGLTADERLEALRRAWRPDGGWTPREDWGRLALVAELDALRAQLAAAQQHNGALSQELDQARTLLRAENDIAMDRLRELREARAELSEALRRLEAL